MPATELKDLILSCPENELFTVDPTGNITGIITFADAKHKILDPEIDMSLLVSQLSDFPAGVRHEEDDLDRALSLFQSTDLPILSVVESLKSMKLIGVVRHRYAILSYNRVLIHARRQESGEN
ncbi:MAG: hypothetical protein CFH37_00087 [Alphaproteobacteria bacterium MarineAlpha9_Bin7]|nr:MAG: hypothetical protein CFH37_00087 [Alphaproteobacteria bacterium MarineAlpha9_Bin7]